MFSLIVAILIVVLLVKCIGLVGGKDGRGETENKEETLKIKMELMGNRRLLIFFTQTRKMHGALWKENKWEAYGWMRKFKNSRR